MKKLLLIFLVSQILPSFLGGEACSQTLADILKSVESGNLHLQSLRKEHAAEVFALWGENVLAGPSLEYSPFYGAGYNGVAESELIVSQEVDFPTKYMERHRQAQLREAALDGAYLSARRGVLLQAEELFLELVRLNKVHSLLEERLSNAETTLAFFQRKMDAGDANILEVNKVKMERMEVLTQDAQLEAERSALLLQLQNLAGGAQFDVLAVDFPLQDAPEDFATFLSLAVNSNADVVAVKGEVRTQEHALRMSRNEWLPSLSVGYRRNTALGASVNGFLVGASFPIYSTRNSVRSAKARLESAQIKEQETRLQAETALRSQYDELMQMQRILQSCDEEMLTSTLALLHKAMNNGEISALQYYNEIGSIYAKLETHIQVHCNYSKLLARLYVNDL